MSVNLITNGTFTTDLTGWTFNGTTQTWQSPGEAKLVTPANTDTAFARYMRQAVTLPGAGGNWRGRITARAAADQVLNVALGPSRTINITTAAQVYDVVFSAVPGGSGNQFYIGLGGINASTTVIVDNVELYFVDAPQLVAAPRGGTTYQLMWAAPPVSGVTTVNVDFGDGTSSGDTALGATGGTYFTHTWPAGVGWVTITVVSGTTTQWLFNPDTGAIATNGVVSNLVKNGTFAVDTSFWAQAGLTSWAVTAGQLVAQVPARKATGASMYDSMVVQNIPMPAAGTYRLIFQAKASVPASITVANVPVQAVTLSTSLTTYTLDFMVPAPEPASQLQFLLGLGAATAWTFTLDNVVLFDIATLPTLTVTFDEMRGYARFVVAKAPAGYTVKRVAENGQSLINIVGFETDHWHAAGGSGVGEDYRVPIGDVVTYALVPVAATFLPAGAVTATITTPGNTSWLRDVRIPALSTKVTVISTGTEAEPVNQRIYEISGRHLPLVVHDVRLGRRGTVTMFVPDRDNRSAIEALLLMGRPLLLNICSSKMWEPCMMAIGEARFTRWGTGAKWTLDFDYVEMEDPFTNVERSATPIWQDVKDGLPAAAGDPVPVTWRWVRQNFATWLQVALGERNP